MEDYPKNWDGDLKLLERISKTRTPLYIITGQPEKVRERFNVSNTIYPPLSALKDSFSMVFTCDVTAIKTAARANPTLFQMKGSIVQRKLSWADFDKVLK